MGSKIPLASWDALYQKALVQEERSSVSKSNFTAIGCDVDSLIRLS
jgi:hypothetical protein